MRDLQVHSLDAPGQLPQLLLHLLRQTRRVSRSRQRLPGERVALGCSQFAGSTARKLNEVDSEWARRQR